MTWLTPTCIAENVYRISAPIEVIEPDIGIRTVNMYLIVGQERAVVIDSGMGIGDVRAVIRQLTSLPCMVLNTHYHWDHIGANRLFAERAIHECESGFLTQESDVSFVRQALQSPAAQAILPSSFDPVTYRIVPTPATHLLHDHEIIDLENHRLRVLHTPGHSPGHVAYFDESSQILFSGDAAYMGPLCASFPESDPMAFTHSVRRLAAMQHVSMLCPGHNEIITDHNWLREAADSIDAAVTGKLKGQLHDSLIPGREFRFESFSLWLPE